MPETNHVSGVYNVTAILWLQFMLLLLLLFWVVGPISTAAMKAYCTLTPMEFRLSSPEALHTKRRERPLLAKDGTKAKEFS
jgi:hypothetical protein